MVDRKTFEQVQQLLASKSASRKAHRTAGDAVLMGKLYDDRGNRMSPSFSTKNGVRYRFYVSSASLRGRKTEAGSVGRVAAVEIESAVFAALKAHQYQENSAPTGIGEVERVVIAGDQLLIRTAGTAGGDGTNREIRIAWSTKAKGATNVEDNDAPQGSHNESLIQSMVRAHVWVHCLRDGVYESIEQLAEANRLHSKVVRQALRLAFLSPGVTSAILEGRQPAGFSPARISETAPAVMERTEDIFR